MAIQVAREASFHLRTVVLIQEAGEEVELGERVALEIAPCARRDLEFVLGLGLIAGRCGIIAVLALEIHAAA